MSSSGKPLRPAERAPRPKTQRNLALGLLVAFAVLLAMAAPAAWWLMQPARHGTVAVAVQTGVLTLQVMCGDKVSWDLPPGLVLGKNASLGDKPLSVNSLTVELTGGARARIERR